MSKYGKKGISLIVLIITIIVTIIIATAIILSIAKNNPITKADEAVFKQDVQVVREMLNDEIADISLKEMMPPTFYTNGGYETKLEDAANMRIRINRLAETPTVGYLYYMVNGKKGCIVFGREEEAKIVTELASNGETSLPNVEYRYTGRELPKYKYKTVLWYVTASNSIALEINDGEYVIDDIKTYYLNLDANGGTITKTTYAQDEEATFTIPNEIPTKTGENAEYRFLNWKEEGTENVYNPGDTITLTGKESVKLIAQYKEVIKYTLKYDLDGGTGTFENVSQYDNSTFVLPSTKPTKEVDGLTYEFKEWKDEANNKTYNIGSSVTILTGTEVTLKAIWQIKYTLSYDLDGGSGTFNSVTQYDNPTFTISTSTPTKNGYNFDGWTGATITNGKVTITSGTEVTLKAKWKETLLADGITKNNIKNYLGKRVNYKANASDTAKWRLFYVDFDNKYKDGAGTIYLKADYDSSRTKKLQDYYYTYSSTIDESTNKVLKMNPLWAAKRAGTTWNENEKASAYLCDTTKWKEYKSTSANYAIGSPSVEMYIDSYNMSKLDNELIGYEYSAPGYKYTVDGVYQNDGWYTNLYTLKLNIMYTNSSKSGAWWLASPSAICSDHVCNVDACDLQVFCRDTDFTYGVCPLVSLPANVTGLSFVD